MLNLASIRTLSQHCEAQERAFVVEVRGERFMERFVAERMRMDRVAALEQRRIWGTR